MTQLSKRTKIVLGILSLWIILYPVGLIASLLLSDSLLIPVNWLFVVHIGTLFMAAGLLLFYIRYMRKAATLSGSQQFFWAAAMLVLGLIAVPLFWYLHIWREN